MTVIIKSMETPKEIEGKSLVHWKMWREAYDDLLPAEFQETMTLERCRLFSQKYPENTLIAIGDLKVVGFISYGNFRDETMQAGEIIALYVLKDYYGKGIAQKLMKAALTALNHFSEIFLWVLKDNKRAIAFYQKMGFTFDGQEKILELGKPIKEKRMVFYSKIILKSRS
ncbi:GNAT family N-acetyltransferase [Streptococcus pneumoniae]|uniref:GNAT family N-acetyltransferase n=1 Tax=Streptococcus pneumoniae TaxID=1313 RepID=UPI000766AEE7|nr:GNAT family N-acetyltransferase [Streptococcus pneumoniae]CVY55063.1 acetyltransferase%2C gnat family [Streptococcus pneumoniae]CWF77011.1 acetyltransferase%2C gnat family [Streptococcus pneumoniae]VIV56359.1 acetyltransferase, gnat family [Streptococcus pneumoniae]VIV76247.1 acetyltransferase, gnat family [Streptococcus pneumoniae]VIY41038.1 acetyltransferase, gnat family [Streptococcus pneumoniae]